MSWIDQAQDSLIIKTGDGREYRPLWKEPQKVIEYNISQFEFPGISGSIVSRGTPKGRKFPLEIYFVGENHLNDCTDFEISASDERHWKMTHPYYGIVNCHPTSINIDNTQGNVSKLTINVIETIVEDNPRGSDTPSDKIIQDGISLSDVFNGVVLVNIPTPNTLDKNLLTKNVTTIYKEGNKLIKEGVDSENYFNAFNNSTAAILNATNDISQAMTSTQALINAPFQFADSVKNRIDMLRNQFNKLVGSVENITNLFVRRSDKIIYENNAGLIISTMAQTSVFNIDYTSAEDVLTVTGILIEIYDQYVANIDALQTDNGGDSDSYIPDAESMIQLQQLVDYTVSKLFEIALDSKQERSIILESDSNVILLAHRLYGLQPDDSTIDYLIATNNFGLNSILQIPAGHKVKYYV